MGARLLADAASIVENREKELGEQETLANSMGLLPTDYESVTAECFAEMCFDSDWKQGVFVCVVSRLIAG